GWDYRTYQIGPLPENGSHPRFKPYGQGLGLEDFDGSDDRPGLPGGAPGMLGGRGPFVGDHEAAIRASYFDKDGKRVTALMGEKPAARVAPASRWDSQLTTGQFVPGQTARDE